MLTEGKKSEISETKSPITSPTDTSQSFPPLISCAFASTPQGILTPPEFANSNFSFAYNSYQLDIISALRGNEHDFLAKAAVADAIRAVQSDEDKMELIDFLASEEHGTIALTLENNACKMFNCSPSELPLVSFDDQTKKHFLSKLCQLFTTAFCQSVPTLFAMLYPLEHFYPNFQVRKIILRHFRDRVLIRMMANFEFGTELFEEDVELERALGQMFGLINIEFCDENEANKSFNNIYANFMGKKDIGKRQEEQGKETNGRMKVGRKEGMAKMGQNKEQWRRDDERRNPTELSKEEPKRMCILNDTTKGKTEIAEIGRKERARTMPSKCVSFWDDHF